MIKTNKLLIITLSVLLCAALLLSGILAIQGVPVVTAATTATAVEVKTITATGEGAIKVIPDMASVTVGVLSEHKELIKAQDDNANKMNAVINSLTDLGIKKEDIKTTGYNISPKYDWDKATSKSVLVGYTVSNTIEVIINDITQSGIVLDKVVANGSNNIHGIRFGVKDETTLYNQALELAVKDAKAKALAMGKGLNITNIEPLHITEASNRYVPIYAEKNMIMDAVNRESTPISLGELDVTASVTVEFTFN